MVFIQIINKHATCDKVEAQEATTDHLTNRTVFPQPCAKDDHHLSWVFVLILNITCIVFRIF